MQKSFTLGTSLKTSVTLQSNSLIEYKEVLWKGIFPSSETQGQIVGTRESLNGRENVARRKVKNGEKSPWGQCLTRPVPNGPRRPGF